MKTEININNISYQGNLVRLKFKNLMKDFFKNTNKEERELVESSQEHQVFKDKLKKFCEITPFELTMTSGHRPEAYNIKVGGAKKSMHTRGLAIDIYDCSKTGSTIANYIIKNIDKYKEIGLYFEDFRYTNGWVHVQSEAPRSGNIIFVPYVGKIPANRINNNISYDS